MASAYILRALVSSLTPASVPIPDTVLVSVSVHRNYICYCLWFIMLIWSYYVNCEHIWKYNVPSHLPLLSFSETPSSGSSDSQSAATANWAKWQWMKTTFMFFLFQTWSCACWTMIRKAVSHHSTPCSTISSRKRPMKEPTPVHLHPPPLLWTTPIQPPLLALSLALVGLHLSWHEVCRVQEDIE